MAGFQYGDQNVFQTNYWWFTAAAVLEVMCIACILPTYWGWRRLGRPVSFSPLELAKAFDAPLLENCSSNATGNDLANIAGSVPVRYGATGKSRGGGSEYEAKRLVFADPRLIYRPLDAFRFGR